MMACSWACCTYHVPVLNVNAWATNCGFVGNNTKVQKPPFASVVLTFSQVKSFINNRQPYGSLSNVLRKPAGEDGT